MRLIPRALQARMTVAALLPALIFILALSALAAITTQGHLEAEIGRRLTTNAAAIASQIPPGPVARLSPDKARTRARLQKQLSVMASAVGARRAFLSDLDGGLLISGGAVLGALDRALAQDRFELAQVHEGHVAASVRFLSDDGRPYQRGYAPLRHEGRVIAAVGVEGRAETYQALTDLRRVMVLAGLLALAGLAAAALLFARALAAPLKRLSAAAARIGAGELEEPLEVGGGGAELEGLSRTMEEMRAALSQRERELQMMLGGIAHEVRNPLGGMELFVGLLKEDLYGKADELELLGRVERELGALKRIVEEFLAYARRQPPERRAVTLGDLIFELAGLTDLRLICEDLEARLWVDPAQLRRLLLNLIRNAAQAGATRLTLIPIEGGLILEDDGPGVPVEVAARAFEAFFTTREKGTGLGLALCAKIAEAHGGRLRLDNPGAPHARFTLTLGGDEA